LVFIELSVFPILCGTLINIATLPLFAGSTVETRWDYQRRAPYAATFLTWTTGTLFMWTVAQGINLLRDYLRKGALFFIRDPRDVDAHPIAEMVSGSPLTSCFVLTVACRFLRRF